MTKKKNHEKYNKNNYRELVFETGNDLFINSVLNNDFNLSKRNEDNQKNKTNNDNKLTSNKLKKKK